MTVRNLMGFTTFVYVIACISAQQACADITVIFDPPPLAGGSRMVSSYTENSVSFNPVGTGDALHVDSGSAGVPDNGTGYFQIMRGVSGWKIQMGGQLFTAKQIDLAEYSIIYQTPATVRFVGYKADGSKISTSFVTDGVIDGSGPVADFQTFIFPSTFADLTRIDVLDVRFSMDNLVLSQPPLNPPPNCTLTVVDARGSSAPANGTHTYVSGTAVSARAQSPVTDGTVSYLCSGASVQGNAYTQVGTTNILMTITNTTTLAWRWATNYWLEVASSGNGTASGSGWYAPGDQANLLATPDAGYEFAGWNDGSQDTSRWVTVSTTGEVFTAQFSPIPLGVLRFARSSYSVSEKATVLNLSVERVDGSYGDASVSYLAVSGTATVDSDFALEVHPLVWTNGESGMKSFDVEILDDEIFEGNESFTIQLVDAAGSELGSPDTTCVTIVDNDLSSIPRFVGVLNFGDVPTNGAQSRTVQVWNDGNMSMAVRSVTVPSGFTATPNAFTVHAGKYATLTVRFAPSELRLYTGSLELDCNAKAGTTSIAVSGTGVLPLPAMGMRTIAGLTASIAIDVPETASVLGVEDELLPGIAPVLITEGGTWDAINRKVKWFFIEHGQVRDRVLQYTVNCAGSVVTGVVNVGSGNVMIEGDTLFSGGANPGVLHPADDNGDWRITLSEVSGSVSRWQNGTDDSKTPVVIRGITLYLQGEQYLYDAGVACEAKRWVPLATVSDSLSACSPAAMSDAVVPVAGAARSVTATNVTLVVTPAPGTMAWGMDESIPEGVTVTWISDGGTFDATHRRIKWSFCDGLARTLSYGLTGVPGACIEVAGCVSFDGTEDPVLGSARVAIPLPFATWADQHGFAGSPEAVFSVMNAEYGLPNGLVYAFTDQLQVGKPLLSIRLVDGTPVVETPQQDPATTAFVAISVVGSTSLLDSAWSLTPEAQNLGSTVIWLTPSQPPRAFFKLHATLN